MGGKGFLSQPDGYSCGIYSILNAITALGGESDRETVKKLAGTTYRDGTSTRGVIRALRALGCNAVYYKTRNPENAIRFARKWASTQPMIVSVDADTHWAVLSGMVDGRIIMVDSGVDGTQHDKGVFPYDRESLLSRWICRGWFKAIRVSRQ